MPQLITGPVVIEAAGNMPKRIEEFVGRASTGHQQVSVAHMRSPAGWVEPGQRPEFEEITVVLAGTLRVEHETGVVDVESGQAVVTRPGEWIRYSSPGPQGAEYIAVCLPAFSPQTVHRDADDPLGRATAHGGGSMTGSQQFIYVTRPTRPEMITEGPTAEEQATVAEHFAYLQELTERGVVILAGRTTNDDATTFGTVVFKAADAQAARRLMDDDPAVQRGVMRAELFPYRVALMGRL